jgi:hypothetical protein
MNDGKLPPPFLVGQSYCDREGEYTVIAIDQDRIAIQRPDGRRTMEDAAMKARIHRNVVMDRHAGVESGARADRSRRRGEPTGRRKELMDRILQLEADGAEHSGVEIDGLLASVVRELGYSEEDISNLHPQTGRSVFANDGDWAKAEMTAERLHEVVNRKVHWEGGTRRECNVYRITSRGLDELRRRV